MSTDPHPVWNQWPPSRPSDTWMLSGGAWIDGARNPPVMYGSAEQIWTAQRNQPPRPCPRPLPRPSLLPPTYNTPSYTVISNPPPYTTNAQISPSSITSTRIAPFNAPEPTASPSNNPSLCTASSNVMSISSLTTTTPSAFSNASSSFIPTPTADPPSNNSSSSVPSQCDHYPSSNYSNNCNAHEVSTTITSTSASHYPFSNYSNTVAPDRNTSEVSTTNTSTSASHYRPSQVNPPSGSLSLFILHSLLTKTIALDPALFVIQVTTLFQVQAQQPRVRSASAAKMQTKSTSLTGKALVLSLDRAGFMKYCLSLHTLEDNFELQRPNGPAFTIYWTGSAGGKSNRLTIKDDDQYKNVQDELKKCNPNQKNFRVIVEFDLDSMISWETHKWCATDYPSTNDNFTELNSGTKIPRLDGFSEEERLVGHFVNEINKKYPCTEHKGEHGNNGTCWKDADNQHVSGNATIKEPPNIPGIESTRDGVPVVRPRGRGPKASLQANAQPSENHTPALLLASVAATLAAVQSHTNSRSRNRSRSRSCSRSHSRSHCRHHRHCSPTPPSSPLKAVNPAIMNLDACLDAFYTLEGHDLRKCEKSLSDLSYTPDLIPELSVEKLAELMNCVEGVALRFCKFCIQWVAKKKHEIQYRT
ncbi:hypothetical protein F5876DRAFT_82908 [Lentinula aff. lateritia]|uniref:Uncharacterized protein n=1 Tax=Lentinula aff. lateritia TaxID=2804960 RepID=A0ACC1TIM7_9AGAR|nr:hypothetical protein F5876DRAFT_82908 [Lentinula aff. lateritia]